MKSSVESLQNRVTDLESVDKSAGQAARNTDLLESQLSWHDQMLTVHDIRLADMDGRFQVLKTASYNGVLIWKIRDYKRQKLESVMGKTLFLYSQPFYPVYFGYKMCAWGWRDGSVVKSNDCSSRGPELNSQQPHGGIQPSAMGTYALFCLKTTTVCS